MSLFGSKKQASLILDVKVECFGLVIDTLEKYGLDRYDLFMEILND